MTVRTAFLLAPGDHLHRANGRRLVVPEGRHGVACEACDWHSFAPTRESTAELLRVTHGLSCHGQGLVDGTFSLHLAEWTDDAGNLTFPRSA